jgi:hypothetical protein
MDVLGTGRREWNVLGTRGPFPLFAGKKTSEDGVAWHGEELVSDVIIYLSAQLYYSAVLLLRQMEDKWSAGKSWWYLLKHAVDYD